MSNPYSVKVYPMAANQFRIYHGDTITFQSYNSTICTKIEDRVILHEPHWDMYSATTNKYLLRFLEEDSINSIRAKVKSGEYEVIA